MKQIVLKSLNLNGYRGQYTKIDFSENITEIYGRNEQGKSTLFDALCQLLTRADSRNRSDFEMFDSNHEYSHDDNPSAEIVGVFNIDSYDVTIKQSASIKFKRNKEIGTYERGSGINYSLSIDDIERSATDYTAWIEANFAPIEKLKIILNIYHFIHNIPKWETQRAFLAELSGVPTKDDFKGDFSELFAMLERYTIAELKQQTTNKMNPLKKQVGRGESLGELQIQINTLNQALPDISGVSIASERRDAIDAEIKQLNADKAGAQEPIKKAMDARNEHSKQIAKAEEDYRIAEREYNAEHNDAVGRLEIELRSINQCNHDIELRNETAERNRANILTSIQSREKQYKENETTLARLRTERDDNKELEFVADNCSYCGQEMPDAMIEDARAKFNKNKDAKHQSIVAKGKALAGEQKQIESEITELKAKYDAPITLEPLKSKEDIEERIAECKAQLINFAMTERGKELTIATDRLRNSMPSIPTVDTAEVDAKIAELDKERTACLEVIAVQRVYENQLQRIKQLRNELRESAQELANLERLANNIKEYEREYAEIVKINTNKLFHKVAVEMLKENKSGDLVDACEILYKGVSTKTLNTASKSLAGMDIVQAFSVANNIKLPIFVDSAESLNMSAFWLTDWQIVKLIVSETDDTLRVELK